MVFWDIALTLRSAKPINGRALLVYKGVNKYDWIKQLTIIISGGNIIIGATYRRLALVY